MSRYYDANGNEISIEEGLRLFGEDNRDRTLARDTRDGVTVSTVLLVIDHAFGHGPPLIFETMIFGGPHDEEQWRYSTRAEALLGHRHACELAFA